MTASASGLDPDISPAAADSRCRASPGRAGCRRPRSYSLVKQQTQGARSGSWVSRGSMSLKLNLALDAWPQ